MIRALFAGRPLWAATMVWNPASPSPGMDDWTSTTFGSAMRICSASLVCSRTACVLVPGGGATVTWRIFSEPALMNAVGRSGASALVTTNSTRAARTTPPSVQRLRSTPLIVGV